MRASALAALAAALGLSGCGDNGTAPASPVKVHTEAQEQLHKANGFNRAIGLKRAIYDSGYACQRVSRTGFIGEYKNLDMWLASCADGRDWAVFIGPDGSAQVRDCKDVAEVGLPKCTVTKEEARAEPEVGPAGNSSGGTD